jgi:hypothetical protein
MRYAERVSTENRFVAERDLPADAERAVATQAADDFQCPLGSVHAGLAGPDEHHRVFVAEGCGRRAIYLRVTFDGHLRRHANAPLVPVRFVRFVALDEDPVAHLRRVLATAALEFPDAVEAESPKDGPFAEALRALTPALAEWHAVQERAASALDCPVRDTIPGTHAPERHLAEGCGRRAWFLPDWPGYWNDKVARMKKRDVRPSEWEVGTGGPPPHDEARATPLPGWFGHK